MCIRQLLETFSPDGLVWRVVPGLPGPLGQKLQANRITSFDHLRVPSGGGSPCSPLCLCVCSQIVHWKYSMCVMYVCVDIWMCVCVCV